MGIRHLDSMQGSRVPETLMAIRLTIRDRRFAADIFARYNTKEGSDYIVSKVALAYLSACLRMFRPRIVVECGAGIGTITDALLSHECGVQHVTSIEHNDFCLGALARNLSHHDPARLTIITDVAELVPTPADMIIGDGSRGRREAYRVARDGSVVFVEGTRSVFRDECLRFLASQGLSVAFTQYGTGALTTLFNSVCRRAAKFACPRIKKGCWIGLVTPPAKC
jgi:spermidine synthase